MEWTGMLVRNFEFNPLKRPIWAWPKLMQTPKRVNTKNQNSFCFVISSRATIYETLTAKNNEIWARTP